MNQINNFLVLIRCMTYNQKAFIEDAMNGFCMQKTSFPFICIIMDDCSTDGEQDTIKNFFQEHFTQLNEKETDNYIFHLGKHKTNENINSFVYFDSFVYFVLKNCNGQYVQPAKIFKTLRTSREIFRGLTPNSQLYPRCPEFTFLSHCFWSR